MCDMVAKRLYDAGYEVDTCYDGEEAFESEMRRQRFLYYLQEGRLRIRLKDWMQGQMTIWKNHFICRNLRRVSEV